MHPMMLAALVESVQRRVDQGDCPTEPPQHREHLEEAVLQLARDGGKFPLLFSNDGLRKKIATDPDDEPSAGAQ